MDAIVVNNAYEIVHVPGRNTFLISVLTENTPDAYMTEQVAVSKDPADQIGFASVELALGFLLRKGCIDKHFVTS